MGRRKTATKSQTNTTTDKTTAPNGKGPVYVDGVLHFGEYDLARYNLAQERLGNLNIKSAYKSLEIQKLQADTANRLRDLRLELAQIALDAKHRKAEMLTLQTEIELAYGLDMSRVSYNDETGRIFVEEADADGNVERVTVPEPTPE